MFLLKFSENPAIIDRFINKFQKMLEEDDEVKRTADEADKEALGAKEALRANFMQKLQEGHSYVAGLKEGLFRPPLTGGGLFEPCPFDPGVLSGCSERARNFREIGRSASGLQDSNREKIAGTCNIRLARIAAKMLLLEGDKTADDRGKLTMGLFEEVSRAEQDLSLLILAISAER